MRRILPLILVFMVGLLVSITGCGGKTEQTGQNGQTTTPAAGEQKYILGVPTGLGAIEPKDALKAAQLAVDEINDAGGIEVGGKKIKFEIESIDTREVEPSLPINDALSAIEKLLNEKKPNAIVVGAHRSEVLLSSMDLIAKYKIPYITTIAVTPEFDKKVAKDPEKYKYFFRTTVNAISFVGNLGKQLAFIGKKFNYNKVYVMYQDVAWASGSAKGIDKFAKANGWTVVGMDAYPGGSTDFSSSLAKAKAAGAQVIVPIFDMPQAGVLVKQARSMKVPALLAGFISPAVPTSAWKTFNGDIDGLVNYVFEPGAIALKNIPKSAEFIKAFAKKYGEEEAANLSGHGPGPAYDTVYLLAEAIKKANSVDSDAVVAALEKTDYDGVVGKIKFNKDHQAVYSDNPSETATSLAFQWRDGKRVVVFPENAAESEIALPPAK